jgi:predicted ABC-class ATPase
MKSTAEIGTQVASGARIVCLDEETRQAIHLVIDGANASAIEGDTLMVAILTNKGRLRRSGFGVCQGLSIVTEQPDTLWQLRM